ncbi:MAG: hypothetical protein QOK05_705 [Chloroflexota bacterium]|jgi:hypothetical protein|nr:hypothetical protein [Chloroflexota bacterium]
MAINQDDPGHTGGSMAEADARRTAMALPGTVEQEHHGRPSFRVRGRIFATMMVPGTMNVMLDFREIMDAVDAHPGVCKEVWWGQRLAAVQVDLAVVQPALLRALLAAAHERKQQTPARSGG